MGPEHSTVLGPDTNTALAPDTSSVLVKLETDDVKLDVNKIPADGSDTFEADDATTKAEESSAEENNKENEITWNQEKEEDKGKFD